MLALIVDDSRFLRQYTRRLLEAFGLACVEAGNGAEALEQLRSSGPFDLMLLDVNMPVMGGLECVRNLREQKLQPAVRVMMLTTECDHSFIEQALDFGADEFLMKPFTPASLREKLEMVGVSA